MAELLLELFSEEIPARMQKRASEDLARLVGERLTQNGLAFTASAAWSTPRRLGLSIDGLPTAQADIREEKKGPRVGSPDKAIEGFLRGAGLTSLDQCEKRSDGKAEFWFAVIERRGRAAAEVLPALLAEAINALPWPKSMRSGTSPFRWVRPLHAIICRFDGAVVPVEVGGVVAGSETRGHRFLSQGPIAVTDTADYRAKLAAAHVVLERDERAAIITRDATAACARDGLTWVEDAGLLDEVVGLVEWPVVLTGRIDEAFMSVPREVLTTSMRTHQKYFAAETADGNLAPRFVVVANMVTVDGGAQVIAGNEKVLRARLSDAKFFWDEDRKARLESRVAALDGIVFHAKLGTLGEKVARLRGLAQAVAKAMGTDAAAADRAALLAKADLTTGMVGEFPELQGIMGRYYARHDGEADAVAEAVALHYQPQGGTACPRASDHPVAVAVGIADRLDTLAGFFKVDEKPTGSKDPFALRRAALGLIRLILENGLRLSLRPLLELAVGQHKAAVAGDRDVVAELVEFIADRLRVSLAEQGIRHDLVAAVFAKGLDDDIVRLFARVEALKGFLAADDGANLLIAYRRAANIVRIEEKRDGTTFDGATDAALLRQAEETALVAVLDEFGHKAARKLADEDFVGAGAELAGLRGPVDAFFAAVTVNADEADLRVNRLRLLARIRGTLDQLADLSKIEG